MAKVLVERPRLGGGVKFQRNAQRAWQRVPPDERPRHESMKERWDHSKVARKSLNENLAPLWRFLRARVGQPWDRVCSEISEQVDRASAVQLHIWQHVELEVLTEPHAIERRMRLPDRGWRPRGFYVDPGTGRLCEFTDGATKRDRRAARVQERRRKRLLLRVNGLWYGRANGVWYEVELAPKTETSAWDVMLRRRTVDLSRAAVLDAYGVPMYAAARRQLGSKEIRRLGEQLERLRARCERIHAGHECDCGCW